MVSIIIPTLNEEKYLPQLLNSIRKQKNINYEIIVADAGSTDTTLEIAKNHNCILIDGGLPAKARNKGAEIASGDFLLFLDADIIIPNNFIEKSIDEIKENKIDFAGYKLIPYSDKKASFKLVNFFYNNPMILLEKILPYAAQAIMIKKSFFLKLGGYDEKIKLAEDHELARRANKIGSFGVIGSTEAYSSDRRFVQDGWIKTGLKYFLCELHMIFLGPVYSDIFNYRFDHYSKKNGKDKTF
jgi:glycosyltransferase involved in cell wall biosynthesis